MEIVCMTNKTQLRTREPESKLRHQLQARALMPAKNTRRLFCVRCICDLEGASRGGRLPSIIVDPSPDLPRTGAYGILTSNLRYAISMEARDKHGYIYL